MRKTKIAATMVAATMLLASCTKEIINTPNATTNAAQTQFTFQENTVFAGLSNPNDKEDHHVNACLYQAGNAIKNALVNNPDQVTTLFSRYESGENAIKIRELVSEESVNFVDGEQYNTFSAMEQSMNYRGINYYNALSFMNTGDAKAVLSNSDRLIIAIAVEVTEDDALPGWVIENGEATEVTILEKDLDGKTPILIVQNSTDHVEYPDSYNPADMQWTGIPRTNNSRTTGPISIDWDSYKIKNGYRYENIGNSELAYEVVFYKPTAPYIDGSWFVTLTNVYGLPNIKIDDKLIKNINSGYISASLLINNNRPFIQAHPADLYDVADAQYHITVYERDWGQSEKLVGNCEGALQNGVKMKYSHEWYYNQYCGFSAKDSFVGASFTVDNAKCTLTLTRTI